jgi:hypothetical protein
MSFERSEQAISSRADKYVEPVEVLTRGLEEIAKSAQRPHELTRLARVDVDITQDDGKSFHAYDTWVGSIEHDTWTTPWAELDDPEEVDEPQKFRLVAKKTETGNFLALQGQLSNNEILSHGIISQITDPETGQETVTITGVDSKVHKDWNNVKAHHFEHFKGYEESSIEPDSPEAEFLYSKIEDLTDLLAAR